MAQFGRACLLQAVLVSVSNCYFLSNRDLGSGAEAGWSHRHLGLGHPTASSNEALIEANKIEEQPQDQIVPLMFLSMKKSPSSHMVSVSLSTRPPTEPRTWSTVGQGWPRFQHMQFIEALLALMKAMSLGVLVATIAFVRFKWQAKAKLKRTDEHISKDSARTTDASTGNVKDKLSCPDANAEHIGKAQEATMRVTEYGEPECVENGDLNMDGVEKAESSSASDGEDSCIFESSCGAGCDVPVCRACAELEPQMCQSCAALFEECKEPEVEESNDGASQLPTPSTEASHCANTTDVGEHGVTPQSLPLVNTGSAATQLNAQYGPCRAGRRFRPAPPPRVPTSFDHAFKKG